MRAILFLLVTSACCLPLTAAVKIEAIEYKCGDVGCTGILAYDDAWTTPRAGVLVVHDWKGITKRTQANAVNLVNLGYVAFCADVYGTGIRPATTEEAGKQAGLYKADRTLMRARMQAALSTLLSTGKVDSTRIGAMGYCFGGTCVLELARAGAPLAGVVTFHGGLSTPTPKDAGNIIGKVLVLRGADDPYVKADEVMAFEEEMRAAKVDWQMDVYGGAVHGFTDRSATTDPTQGYAYNAAADRRSWQAMRFFFSQVLSSPY